MTVEAKINEEVLYGIIPMKRGERIYSFFDVLLVTGGYAIATWCYVTGGYIATMVGFWQFVTSLIGVTAVSGLFLCLVAIIGTRYGIDQWIYSRAVFGYKGVIVLLFIVFVPGWGWYALNAQMYALSIWRILEAAGLTLSEGWIPWIALTSILFGWWIGMKGPHAVKWTTRIMVPSLLLVGLFIAIMVFITTSLSELVAMEPIYAGYYEDPRVPYMLVNEWVLASAASWVTVIGVLTRLAKKERGGYWGIWLGYYMLSALFMVLGALTGLLMGSMTGAASTDPTEWLIALGGVGLGTISLIFVGVANITTMAVGLYAGTVVTKVLRPSWSYKVVCSFWALWSAALTLWGGIWLYYETYLAIVGAFLGPFGAVIIADYYLIRKQRVHMASLYDLKNGGYRYTSGFNIISIVAFTVGVVSYFLVYDPILIVPRSAIFLYTTATGLATAVSFICYIILSQVPALRNYLLPEQKAIRGSVSGSGGNVAS